MAVLQILRWFLLAEEMLVALPIIYLCILSLAAIMATRRSKRQKTNTTSRTMTRYAHFAIVVPAHNEETLLGTLLESLAQLDYPKDSYSVHVIADNCTDRTAALAQASGWVHTHERFDQDKRGKGFALNWFFQKLVEGHLTYDAYVILDADSVVEPNFLLAMNRELMRGAQALQACNTVLNTSESPSTCLRWIALTLMNHVRPLGRNTLGCSSTLTGNGMCLISELLKNHPWQAFSLAEDYEYYLNLVQRGGSVRYVPDAIVRSQMPTTFAQMRTQDIRWEANERSQPTRQRAWRLLTAGIKNHDFVRLEAVAELLTPPLSSLLGWCLVSLIASLLLWSLPCLLVSLLLIAGLVCYIGTAFYLLRPPRAVYVALLHAPGFVLWKLWIILVLRRRKKRAAAWVRTSRTSQG